MCSGARFGAQFLLVIPPPAALRFAGGYSRTHLWCVQIASRGPNAIHLLDRILVMTSAHVRATAFRAAFGERGLPGQVISKRGRPLSLKAAWESDICTLTTPATIVAFVFSAANFNFCAESAREFSLGRSAAQPQAVSR